MCFDVMAEIEAILNKDNKPRKQASYKEVFYNTVTKLKEVKNRGCAITNASNGTVELIEYDDAFYTIINCLAEAYFTPAVYDIIIWWVYEDTEKAIYNTDGTLYKEVKTIDQLYEYAKEVKSAR